MHAIILPVETAHTDYVPQGHSFYDLTLLILSLDSLYPFGYICDLHSLISQDIFKLRGTESLLTPQDIFYVLCLSLLEDYI